MKTKIKELFYNVLSRTNHFEEENTEEKFSSNLYKFDSTENLSTVELLDKLDTLILEESKKFPFTKKRVVSEEKFQEIYDDLRIKILTLTGSIPTRTQKNFSNDASNNIQQAREYSSQIKELSNKYCIDLLNKTEKFFEDAVKEIEENKKELVS